MHAPTKQTVKKNISTKSINMLGHIGFFTWNEMMIHIAKKAKTDTMGAKISSCDFCSLSPKNKNKRYIRTLRIVSADNSIL